jgi:hypothetical protein
MENLSLHQMRAMRDIARDMRAGGVVALDGANDAWLYTDGEVATRAKGIIGDVGHLRGAARIMRARKLVRLARGF